jgi:hypothetical protein
MGRQAGALILALVLCASATGAASAARERSELTVREIAVVRTSEALERERRAVVGFGHFLHAPGHGQTYLLVAAEKNMNKGSDYVQSAEEAVQGYAKGAAALPGSKRKAAARAHAQRVEQLLVKAAQYDDAAAALFHSIDRAYAAWNAYNHVAQKATLKRLAGQIVDDLTSAQSAKRTALAAAKTLPPLPKPTRA